MLLHQDAPAVVAVDETNTVVALHDLGHLVESGVGNGLGVRGKQSCCGLRRRDGVYLGVVEHGLREHRGHLGRAVHRRHRLPRGHAAQRVVGHGAVKVLPRGSLQRDTGQTVHVVVCEAFTHVRPAVLLGG